MSKFRILAYILIVAVFSVPLWGNIQGTKKAPTLLFTQHLNDSLLKHKPVLEIIHPLNPQEVSKKTFGHTAKQYMRKELKRLMMTSFLPDSVRNDTTKNKSILDAKVDYTANDSLVMTKGNMGYLYGSATVKYADINLKSEQINIDMDSSLISAKYGKDSIGKEFGYPVFTDHGTDYQSKTLKYNIKTKRGYITDIITQQGEGYVVAKQAKKNDDGSFFMKGGKYTTCDDKEHPHFYLALTKAKVRPNKNVVTGPAYLVIEGLPIPFVGLPFGFFPFTKKYSSGVIMPSYGDEMERGFNLHDGGYYFAFNDNIDLSLTGEIFTKGSWGLNARSTYVKRYKYSGNFDIGYKYTKLGEKGIDQTVSKDISINWTHTQDPKANMYRTLSASVNFSSSSYDRNDLNKQFTPDATQNTKSSSINLTQKIPNSPWSFAASMDVSQRTQDSSVSMSLPNLTITMSRIYPFKRKDAVGSEKWYEKIGLSYTGQFRNNIETKENKIFKANLIRDWQNAMSHNIPIDATFNAFNVLNITPSFTYNERWYTHKTLKRWNPITKTNVAADTTYGFNRDYDFNAALQFSTKLYGYFKPLFAKKTLIRHVFTPTISFSYAPDFSDPRWGIYQSYDYYDANGQLQKYTYSPYEGQMFGTAPSGKQGVINFQFDNNLEMKTPSQSDSTGFKKLSLIDNLGIGFSYNMAATQFNWSDVNTSLRLKLSKSLTVNLNGVWDPYLYKILPGTSQPTRVNELRIAKGKFFGRLKSTGYSISPSINQDTFKKWFGKDSKNTDDKKKKKKDNNADNSSNPDQTSDTKQSGGSGEYDKDGYLRNEVKWNLSFNLSMDYAYNSGKWGNPDKNGYVEYKGQLNKNFGLSGNIQPTKNWSFNFNASYDFDQKKISYMTCNLTRNLHCWQITASFNPVGPYKNYYVSIRANASMLQDLKYETRNRASSYDPKWD